MRFTKRTYRRAMGRSIERELWFFNRGMTEEWWRQKNHTDSIRRRKRRERVA